jgi:hypothetical protein
MAVSCARASLTGRVSRTSFDDSAQIISIIAFNSMPGRAGLLARTTWLSCGDACSTSPVNTARSRANFSAIASVSQCAVGTEARFAASTALAVTVSSIERTSQVFAIVPTPHHKCRDAP